MFKHDVPRVRPGMFIERVIGPKFADILRGVKHRISRAVRLFSDYVSCRMICLTRRAGFESRYCNLGETDGRKARVITIMPCYNHLEYTKQAVDSYYKSLDGANNHVLVIIDDCSTDGTKDFFLGEGRRHANMCYFRYKANLGLTQAWNDGVRFAVSRLAADYIILANSDIIIPKGSIERIIRVFRENAGVGVVGVLTNGYMMCHKKQDIRLYCPGYAPSEDAADIEDVSERVKGNKPVPADVDAHGFFWCFTREACAKNVFFRFPRPYYFDPSRKNFGNEVEFQMRLRKTGLKTLIAADVFVFHYTDVSQERFPEGMENVFRLGKVKGRGQSDAKK
ncbi:MAG: glycosyltransferase family A protein [Candidatus Omnitrophota bacterium]